MFRYVEVPAIARASTHSYTHQFDIAVSEGASWKPLDRAIYASEVLDWTRQHLGLYGDMWIVQEYRVMIREFTAAFEFKMRWG